MRITAVQSRQSFRYIPLGSNHPQQPVRLRVRSAQVTHMDNCHGLTDQ